MKSNLHVVEIGVNTNVFFRKWSNGFIEQWCLFSYQSNAANQVKTFTFHYPFSSNNYAILTGGGSESSNTSSLRTFAVRNKTTTSISIYIYTPVSTYNCSIYVCGY